MLGVARGKPICGIWKCVEQDDDDLQVSLLSSVLDIESWSWQFLNRLTVINYKICGPKNLTLNKCW